MSIHLLNGTKEPRVKNSEGCTVLPCGCAYTTRNDISTYSQMCAPHHADWQALHEAARIARAEGRA